MNLNSVQNFRENVEREYKSRNWTQDDLAGAAGIGRPSLNRILNKKAVPGLDTCEAIANALGIPLEELISSGATILS